jgi:hypothetical protein
VSANRSARLAGNSPRDVSRAYSAPTIACFCLFTAVGARLYRLASFCLHSIAQSHPSNMLWCVVFFVVARQLPPSAMFKPSQMDPRDFQQPQTGGASSYRYKEPEKVTGYVAQYIS